MNRRSFLHISLGLAVSGILKAAVMPIGPQSPMGQRWRAFVSNPVREVQNCEFWCWAASISMIFKAHGHNLSQDEIVRRSFNSSTAFCVTGSSSLVGNSLSRSWVDSNNVLFTSQVIAAYDIYNQLYAINNMIIISELANNRPLLYANMHHAMVIVSAEYIMTQMGPTIQSVWVLDPWPASPAFHALTVSEMLPAHLGGEMTFLAAVQTT